MKSILCIEDDFNAQMLLKIYFRGEKYRLTIAKNGIEALKCLEEASFDVIISDWNLQGSIHQNELIDEIRAHYPVGTVPLFIMSAEMGLNLDTLINEGKVQKVLQKPILKKDLLAYVDAATTSEKPLNFYRGKL